MVPKAGFEPARVSPPPPQDGVSTRFHHFGIVWFILQAWSAQKAPPVYQPVWPAGPEQDAGPGTDFHALRNGFVSVTPLQVDLTRYSSLDPLGHWLEGCR